MKNIIMCGGSGTRLWPISRKSYPKQFCNIGMDETLFQQTISRNRMLCDEVVIVTNKDQYFHASNQMEELEFDSYRIILEPVGRNTAPAIALACLMFDEDDIVLVSAADHLINNKEEYNNVVAKANELAEQGFIVTFGIVPNYPETGYGYIESNGLDVISFKEKPDTETANYYIDKGNYYWNSGMFVFKVKTFLDELKKFAPEVLEFSKKAMDSDGRIVEVDKGKMLAIPSISVDYAVMEHSQIIKVIPADIDWSDLGGYESLYSNYDKDTDGNVKIGNIINIDSSNNLVLSDNRLIVVSDIKDLIIVDTEDALFISKKGCSHKIKTLLPQIESICPDITSYHNTIERPWGSYTILSEDESFKVKRLNIKPNKALSKHSHIGRSEHLTVVKGTAKINVDGNDVIVNKGESLFIAEGMTHKIQNNNNDMLIIIQTATGNNLDEQKI